MILLGSNHYTSAVASFNTHSIDLERDSSQYLSITDNSDYSFTGDFTIEFGINFESLPSSSNLYIVSKWDGGGNQRSYSLRYSTSTNTLLFRLSSNGTNTDGPAGQANFSWTPSTATWYHLAITYDASAGQMEFFLNGVSQGTDTGTLPTSIYDSTAPLQIGALGGSNTFDGKLDDFRLWNDIRTSGEISSNYNTELIGNEAGLVGYYKFNNDANDSTSNGNDLTETNSPVYSTDTPF